jgi:hypothetical protein
MALRGRKPELQPNRFRALVYGTKGTGKSHFACTIPNTYYIDSEGILKYKRYVNMLKEGNSDVVEIRELTEIITEVKELLTVKHDYKTIVIDSITFPETFMSNVEAERLIKKSPATEGTEFGANKAKAARLTFHLGMLLSRLDMNVIVLAHEKTKYQDGKEIGQTADCHEKMGYALGTVIQLRMHGKSRKAFVEKTRYDELKTFDSLDFTENGYKTLVEAFGEDMFVRDATIEELATKEQISEFRRLIELLKFPEETVQKWIIASNSQSMDEMPTIKIQKCIESLKAKVNGE